MKFALGTKLDIDDYRKAGPWAAAALAAAMLVCMAGYAAASPANDSLAGLADPTQPVYGGASGAAVAQKSAGPMLQSTFISTNQRRAVISGKTYAVGDKFGGAVITEILPYEVVMKRAGKESHLRLLPKLAKEIFIVKVPANGQEGKNDK